MATVRRIFDLAAAIIFEQYGGDTDFDKYSPMLLEQLLVEAMPYENMIRRQAGKPLVEHVPELTAIDDTEIDWDDRITRDALPSGLASRLMLDSPDKKAEMVIEYNRFVGALEDAAPAIPEVGDDGEED